MDNKVWQRRYLALHWGCRTDAQTAYHRAGGRRRYNAERARERIRRRDRVAAIAVELGPRFFTRGAQAEIARRLGVHRSTVCRDLEEILAELSPRGWRFSYGLLQALATPIRLRVGTRDVPLQETKRARQ